jgi:Domain of unknown function (DUF397)
MTDMTRSVTSEPEWIKSSLSFANGNCVEVQIFEDGSVNVRNSRRPEEGILCFTPGEWHDFIGGCKLGEFSGPGTQRTPSETGG